MSRSSVRETEEHELLAQALELGDLSDHGELGTALHKVPGPHVRNGLFASSLASAFRFCFTAVSGHVPGPLVCRLARRATQLMARLSVSRSLA
jgi:hypothetical protein